MVPSVELKPEATQCYMKFQHPEGDHFTLINIYKAFKQCQQDPCEWAEHRHAQSHNVYTNDKFPTV